MRWRRALKTEYHRYFDPLIAWRCSGHWREALHDLPDGEYRLPLDVPYVPQFASREHINDYIHNGYDGKQDPLWQTFGADDPQDYAFWSARVCALACLKMAIHAHGTANDPPSLWQLVQAGLAADGYLVYDKDGNWRDEGWYVDAQIKVARDYGVKMESYGYAAPVGIAHAIYKGKLAAATVTPEIGERKPLTRRYAGHLVLVHGFRWANRQVSALLIHNPSGRYPELQADAWISAKRFRQSYAYRFATYEPLD